MIAHRLQRGIGIKPIDPAILDRKYFATERVRNALPFLQKCLAGEGQLLGRGDTGVGYKVSIGDEIRLVKLGSKLTIAARHGLSPLKLRYKLRQDLLNEAALSDALRAKGHTCVPDSVFLEHGSAIAIVREYGDTTQPVTLSEIDDFAEQLNAVARDGYYVWDSLLVFRRKSGSLFVGDIGMWWRSNNIHDPELYQKRKADLLVLLREWMKYPTLFEIDFYKEKLLEAELAGWEGMVPYYRNKLIIALAEREIQNDQLR